MKTFHFFPYGSKLLLGAALLCSAGSLRAAEDVASATPTWPRFCTVDDDDVVIYQPKVEKWDQKSVEVRFQMSIKGKNDEKPVYGSFLAKAETTPDLAKRTVSIFNVQEMDFRFPNSEDRIEHIKRDVAAVSPEKVSVPMDELVVSNAPTGDAVASEESASIDNAEDHSDGSSSKTKKVVNHHPRNYTKKKSEDKNAVVNVSPLSNDETPVVKKTNDDVVTDAPLLAPQQDDTPILVKHDDTPPAFHKHKTVSKDDSPPPAHRTVKKTSSSDDDSPPAVVHHTTKRISSDDSDSPPSVKHHVDDDDSPPPVKHHVVSKDDDQDDSPRTTTHVRHVKVVPSQHVVVVKRAGVVHHVHHHYLLKVRSSN